MRLSSHAHPGALLALAFALILAPALLLAQEPPADAAPAAIGARITFAPGINPDEKVPQISFADMEVKDVLTQLEWLTGRIIIRPQGLPGVLLTLNTKGSDLTRAEALVAFESLLSINGIGLAPLGDRFIKVVSTGQIRSEAPELVVGSLRDEPASGKIVSKLFRLQYLDSASFQTQIAPFLSQFGFVVPFQNSNAVIVTDTVANLQRLEYLVSEVDRRLNIETRFYQINYANASDLAQSIRAMLESARAGFAGGRTASGGGQMANAPTPPPGAPPAPAAPVPGAGEAGGAPLQVVLSTNTSINADERTNQLIVITDPANLTFFDNLIAKLDVPAEPPTTIEVFPMNYAKADELAGLLTSFISGRSGSSSRGSTSRSSNRGRPATFASLGSSMNQAQPKPEPTPQQQQRAQAVQGVLQGEGQSSNFSQYMTVVSDERTNAIVVSGTASDLELIRKIIGKLDIILAQVRIEVVIAEVTLSKNLVRGIDAFTGHYEEESGKLTITTSKSGSGDSATFTGPLGGSVTGSLVGGALRDITLDTVFSAARTNNDVHLLSVPTIVTTHNQKAMILVGEARPIVTSTQTGLTTTGVVSQSVQYQDIPLQLDVTPIIGPNDVVQLEIDQQVNAVTDFVSIGGDQQPVVSRRQAQSYLTAKSGQLIVLGGLQRSFNSRTKRHMFILGEIPILGELFTRTTNDNQRTELLLFLKPTVIRDTDAGDANARASIRELHPSKEDKEILDPVTGEKSAPEPKETDETRRRANRGP